MCVDFLYSIFVWNISHSKKNSASYYHNVLGIHYRTRYSCQILMKIEFSRQIFEVYSNFKVHENPFSGNGVVPRRRTDMRKLIGAFRNFADAPKAAPINSTPFCSHVTTR